MRTTEGLHISKLFSFPRKSNIGSKPRRIADYIEKFQGESANGVPVVSSRVKHICIEIRSLISEDRVIGV